MATIGRFAGNYLGDWVGASGEANPVNYLDAGLVAQGAGSAQLSARQYMSAGMVAGGTSNCILWPEIDAATKPSSGGGITIHLPRYTPPARPARQAIEENEALLLAMIY